MRLYVYSEQWKSICRVKMLYMRKWSASTPNAEFPFKISIFFYFLFSVVWVSHSYFLLMAIVHKLMSALGCYPFSLIELDNKVPNMANSTLAPFFSLVWNSIFWVNHDKKEAQNWKYFFRVTIDKKLLLVHMCMRILYSCIQIAQTNLIFYI